MPETADNLARDHQLSREECDLFALGSQQKYANAAKDGFFQSEIHPISIPQGRNKPDLTSPTTSIRAPRRRWTRCSSSNRFSRRA